MTRRVVAAALLVRCLWSQGSAAAQAPPAQIFRSAVELIAIDVQVVDRRGVPRHRARSGSLRSDCRRTAAPRRLGAFRRRTSDVAAEWRPTARAEAVTPHGLPAPGGRVVILAIDAGSFEAAAANGAAMAARSLIDSASPGRSRRAVYLSARTEDRTDAGSRRDSLRAHQGGRPARHRAQKSSFISVRRSCSISGSGRSCRSARATISRRRSAARTSTTRTSCSAGPAVGHGPRQHDGGGRRGPRRARHARVALPRSRPGARTEDGRARQRGTAGERLARHASQPRRSGHAARQSRRDGEHGDLHALRRSELARSVSGRDAQAERHVDQPRRATARCSAAGSIVFSGSAGGSLLRVAAGDGTSAFRRIATEMSAYYLLGVEPAESDRDGRAHQIQVKVNQRDAHVRGRWWVVVPRRPCGGDAAADRWTGSRGPGAAAPRPGRTAAAPGARARRTADGGVRTRGLCGAVYRAISAEPALANVIREFRSADPPWPSAPRRTAAFALEFALGALAHAQRLCGGRGDEAAGRDQRGDPPAGARRPVRVRVVPDGVGGASGTVADRCRRIMLDAGAPAVSARAALRARARRHCRATGADGRAARWSGGRSATPSATDALRLYDSAFALARHRARSARPRRMAHACARCRARAWRSSTACAHPLEDPAVRYFSELVRGQTLRALGRTDAAAAAYRAALATWPGAQSARVALMTIQLAGGQHEEAWQLAERFSAPATTRSIRGGRTSRATSVCSARCGPSCERSCGEGRHRARRRGGDRRGAAGRPGATGVVPRPDRFGPRRCRRARSRPAGHRPHCARLRDLRQRRAAGDRRPQSRVDADRSDGRARYQRQRERRRADAAPATPSSNCAPTCVRRIG